MDYRVRRMLYKSSVVGIADNTGATHTRIIQIYPGNARYATAGLVVKHAIQRIRRILPWGKLKRARTKKIVFRKQVRKGWLVRVRAARQYEDGTTVSFLENSLVLLYRLRGIRIYNGRRFFGIVSRKVRHRKTRNLFRVCL
uniref:Ribosomal protein L14 n=1 Tax=Nyctotherus ovalis TaxID=70075 RepID=F1AAK6_NYCOV|nr:ribosomal protein L14 [Nyctotherus ovalis]